MIVIKFTGPSLDIISQSDLKCTNKYCIDRYLDRTLATIEALYRSSDMYLDMLSGIRLATQILGIVYAINITRNFELLFVATRTTRLSRGRPTIEPVSITSDRLQVDEDTFLTLYIGS